MNADRILVIERGRVVEEGPPRELLRCNGPYRRLMRLSQARPPFTSVPPPELELMPASA